MNKYCIFFILIIFFSCTKDEDPLADGETRYDVSFTLNWSKQDFPINYPSNAHFSKLIGWSHPADNDFFKIGTIASEGIENMAETGGTSPLDNEISTKISNGEGLKLITGKGLSDGTGTIEVIADVNINNPSVTLATMIAPSPDWYVAVVNINLFENGEFVAEKIVDGLVYDAGTDSGTSYMSSDLNTNPKSPISMFVDSPLGNGNQLAPTIAEVKFTRR